MAKSKNNLPGLPGLTTKSTGLLSKAPGLVNTTTPTGGSVRLGSSGGTSSLGVNANKVSSGINFGKPPAVKTTSTPGTNWSQLVGQAVNSGVASLFGGGLNLTGIGSVVSTIANLFGHQKSLPTLTPFQLNPSQNESITVSGGNMNVSTQTIQDQSAQIAQAVKTAVLNSSTLNDVLSEL